MTPTPHPELPLDHESAQRVTLRWAHARAGLETPFEQAMANPILRRCLENVVSAANRRRGA